nr:retrovirus-related Pol polyprotein from transposon TNT 1-94 [Tanacetum cinerariifolium]
YVVPTGRVVVPTGMYGGSTGRVVVPTDRYVVPTGRVVVPIGRVVVPTGMYGVPTGRVVVPTCRVVVPTGRLRGNHFYVTIKDQKSKSQVRPEKSKDFRLFQMDVKSAVLNGFINEEVYVTQP